MNFVERIIQAGFVEQIQLRIFKFYPRNNSDVPRWWERYNTQDGWFGVSRYHPDALFTKEGENKEFRLSLQGVLTGYPDREEDVALMDRVAARYICLLVGGRKIYETFSGEIPPEEVVTQFIEST